MSAHAEIVPVSDYAGTGKQRVYKTMVIMASTAVIISAAIIIFFNQSNSADASMEIGGRIQLLTATLLPYLISAGIAAMTAIGILSMLSSARAFDPAQLILYRLRDLGMGNLQSTIKVGNDHQLKALATELNAAVGSLGHNLTQLKVVNRQQWKVLCDIRSAAIGGNCDEVVRQVEEMEKNWAKIAEIEERLIT